MYVTVKAHKECQLNGTWYMHPETHKVWSNYTTCINLADLSVSMTILQNYNSSITSNNFYSDTI